MELTPEDTQKDLHNLIIDAIPGFEFPRKSLEYSSSVGWKPVEEITEEDNVIFSDEDSGLVDNSAFAADLTSEEINILAILMMCGWVQRQVTSIENTRMKYSGSDFKMTSQANHLQKLLSLLTEVQRQSHHMQRLYRRRRTNDDGLIESNWSVLREVSTNDD